MSSENMPIACQTAACLNTSAYLWDAVSPQFHTVRKCSNWGEFVCGGYQQKRKLLDHRPRATTMTDLSDDVDRILRDFLIKPYVEVSKSLAHAELKLEGSEEEDGKNLASVQNYYRNCLEKMDEHIAESVFLQLMQEVNEAFSPLDALMPATREGNLTTYKPVIDTTQPMAAEDWSMLGKAQTNLARLGIYPFAKLTVEKSLFYPDQSVVSVVPHSQTAVPSKWWFDKKFDILPNYWEQLEIFLDHAHAHRAPRIQQMRILPDKITTLEKELLNIRLAPGVARLFKGHTGMANLDQLGSVAPALRLNETVMSLGNGTVRRVEVQWSAYFMELHQVLVRHSRETIRSYVLWQAFLQTQDLWEMDWASNWRHYSQHKWGTPANLTHEEKCLARTQKHFGHILDSFYIRKEFSKQDIAAGEELVDRIRKEWMVMVNTTDWMSRRARNFTLDKLSKMQISVGYPGSPRILKPESLARHYSGVELHYGKDASHVEDDSPRTAFSLQRPDKWTHLHNYFSMERWYTNKTWTRLNETDRSIKEWPVSAHSQAPYYSHGRNQFILPAGIMRTPIWALTLPSFAQYAGLGSFVGKEMIKAVNGVGQQYQANGIIVGKTWTKKDWRRYDMKRVCYSWRWHEQYDNGGRSYDYSLRNTWEAAMAETEGMEVAYRVWNSSTERAQDLWLPGFEVFSRQELYWMVRTLPYCGKDRGGSWKEHYVLYGDKPPYWRAATEPIYDFYPFKKDNDCSCYRCFTQFCWTYGNGIRFGYASP